MRWSSSEIVDQSGNDFSLRSGPLLSRILAAQDNSISGMTVAAHPC